MQKPSLILRTAIGKLIGFVAGLVAYFMLPIWGEPDLLFRIGIVLYLTTIGGVIGLMGVMTFHPVLRFAMPWWFRGPFTGAFMMALLWLLAHERMDAIMVTIFGEGSFFAHGAWAIIDGVILGLIIGWTASRFGGEGKETVGQ